MIYMVVLGAITGTAVGSIIGGTGVYLIVRLRMGSHVQNRSNKISSADGKCYVRYTPSRS